MSRPQDPSSQGTFDVLVFSPHPDDAEMTVAGTMIRLIRSGRRILSVALTGGEKGTYGDRETRAREFAAANEVIGSSGRILDFPDTEVFNSPQGRLTIARVVREHRPSIVFAPYHTNRFDHHDGTANSDHFATGQLVRDGLKLARFRNVMPEIPAHDVRRLFYYMVPKDMMPTMVVDVSEVMDDVHRAIQAYESQMKIWKAENSILPLLDTVRAYYGIRIGRKYGEAFLSDEALAFAPDLFFLV
ncbi:MAG: PIG-L family deacetylase [Candidatus Eisenbacteria bacterium]|nr:PIG-L family deacetylase [Candidatus Eisenbacteria bacterium]